MLVNRRAHSTRRERSCSIVAMASIVAPLARVAAPVAAAKPHRRAASKAVAAPRRSDKIALASSVAASSSALLYSAPAFAAEVAQLADGSLEDAIPTIAVVASLGVVLYSSAGALKGLAAVLFGGAEATASHILVKDKGTAESLLERLRDGPQDNLEDRFAREAGKYSECPSKSKGGSLGTFKPGQMVKEFDTAVFNGPVGVIQGPVQTQFGYHLILVTDRTEQEK
jgi:peptidyl-prolyl cis-trans isomerase C